MKICREEVQLGENLAERDGRSAANKLWNVAARRVARARQVKGMRPIPFPLMNVQQNQKLHKVNVVLGMSLPVYGRQTQEPLVWSWGLL